MARSGPEINELAHGRAGLQGCEALVDLGEPEAAGEPDPAVWLCSTAAFIAHLPENSFARC
jgi:hypothetical protein